jgi:hypothetical protein
MGIFSKPKTVAQVAKDFPEQEQYLKMTLWKGLIKTQDPSYDFKGEDTPEQNYMATLYGQVISYVFADDPNAYDHDLPKEQIKLIKDIRKTLPEDSHELMMSNKEIRQIVVYTLRMRLLLKGMIEGADWVNAVEGKRVWNILQIYGDEFPEEVDDKMFDKLVKKTMRASIWNEATWDSQKSKPKKVDK